ncbi:hypothetical protein Tco_1296509, partial [Tanacetum coccineum]
KSSDTTINFVAQSTHDQEDSPSTSSIIVDIHEAPHVVTTFEEQTSPISLQESDEFNQEDSADFDGNTHLDKRSSSRPSYCTIEPKNIKEAMADHSWIKSMQKERMLLLLNGFGRISAMQRILWFGTNLVLWLKVISKKKALILRSHLLLLLVI